MPLPLLSMLADIGNLLQKSPAAAGLQSAPMGLPSTQPGFSLMGKLPPLVPFMPAEPAPRVPGTPTVTQSVPIGLGLGPDTSAQSPGTTVDKIVGGLEKVNRILEATPFLGHILRSTAGELQERSLPVQLQRAELLGRDRMWEEMMRNIRGKEQNRARVRAAEIGAGATERGARARAGATMEAARTRAIGDLIWQYQQADEGTKRLIRSALNRYGLSVPADAEAEEARGLWERALDALSLDRLRSLLSRTKTQKGRPPLDSFFKQ